MSLPDILMATLAGTPESMWPMRSVRGPLMAAKVPGTAFIFLLISFSISVRERVLDSSSSMSNSTVDTGTTWSPRSALPAR